MTNALYDVPGPQGRRTIRLWSLLILVIFAIVVGIGLANLAQQGMLDPALWRMVVDPEVVGFLLQGVGSTIQAAIVAMLISLAFGLVLSLGKLSHLRWVSIPTSYWVEVFRSMPLLMLIFFIYLGGPAIGVVVSTFWSLVIGLTLYNSAVIADIMCAGILALPRGQSEAAYALGLGRSTTFALILVPQAIRNMLPALMNQAVTVIKETSLGFTIGYTELMLNGKTAVEFLGGQYALPVYTGVAAIYIVLCLCVSGFANWLSRRTRAGYGRSASAQIGPQLVQEVGGGNRLAAGS